MLAATGRQREALVHLEVAGGGLPALGHACAMLGNTGPACAAVDLALCALVQALPSLRPLASSGRGHFGSAAGDWLQPLFCSLRLMGVLAGPASLDHSHPSPLHMQLAAPGCPMHSATTLALIAGHIFAAQLASAPADSAPAAGIPQGSVLNAEGTGPISQAEAATAAAAAYRHAQAVVASVSASDEGAVDPAARQRMLCHLHQAECAVLQRAAALPSAAAGAAADALGCWGRARALGCAAAAPVGSGKGRGSSPVEGQQEEGDILDAERDEL